MTERRTLGKVRILAFVVLVLIAALVAAEFALRSSRRYATGTELAGREYVSPRDTSRFTIPWVGFDQGVRVNFVHRAPEFSFGVQTNANGIRDSDHPVHREPGEFRIVALGDSFTASHGVEWVDGWTEQLERRLAAELGAPVRVISGGIPGHDPVFSYHLYEQRLRVFEPDVVLLVINSSDVHDVAMRGGMDRFDEDGMVKAPFEPLDERLARYSHLYRGLQIVLQQDNRMARQTLIRIDDEDRARAHGQIVQAAAALSARAAEDEARFLLVVHPHTEEVMQPHLSIMNQVIRGARGAGLPTVDLGPFFRDAVDVSQVDRWFYPVDGHCTTLGYAVFAEAVQEALRGENLLPTAAARPIGVTIRPDLEVEE